MSYETIDLLERLQTNVNLNTLGEDRTRIESMLDKLGDTSGTKLKDIWGQEVRSKKGMPSSKLDVIDDIMASRYGREYTKYLKGQVGESKGKIDVSKMGDDKLVARYRKQDKKLDWAKEKGGGEVWGSELYREVSNMAKEIRRRGLEIGESHGGDNIYMRMPIDRVIQDAKNGVLAAKDAWYKRDREGASKALGHIKYPGEEKESKLREENIEVVSKEKISNELYDKSFSKLTDEEKKEVNKRWKDRLMGRESELPAKTKDVESPEATAKPDDKVDVDPEAQSMELGDKEPEKSKQDTMTKPSEKELEQLIDKMANEDNVSTMFAQDKVDVYQKKVDDLTAQAKQLEKEQKGTKKSTRGYQLQGLYAKIDEYGKKIAQAKSEMGERKQLYICNKCTKTFRSDVNECLFCKSVNVEKIGVKVKETKDWDLKIKYPHTQMINNPITDREGNPFYPQKSSMNSKRVKVYNEEQATWVKGKGGIPIVEESKLKEQEDDKLTIIAKGIVDKNEADEMARDKKGMVVQDETDEKKFMVIVKEKKLTEDARSTVINALQPHGYSLFSEEFDKDTGIRTLVLRKGDEKLEVKVLSTFKQFSELSPRAQRRWINK